jgi:hypothetical protein
MSDRTLAESSFSHVINAPIELVDIADWLFHLPNAEYRRCCPPAHIAAGATMTDDGQRMSINVEMIGENLMIQQYAGEVTDPDHCRMVSTSDVFSPLGRTTSRVLWDLSVRRIDDDSCEYTNHVKGIATDEFLALLEARDVPFERAAAADQQASSAHNEKETPLYAQSIERHALAVTGGPVSPSR